MVWRTAAVPQTETVYCTTTWIWSQSGGLLFGHYGSKDDRSPRDSVVHHRLNMVTVLGTVVGLLWFKRPQQSQGLCGAPLYEYGYSLGECCLVPIIRTTIAISETVCCHHMNNVTVFGTVCGILANTGKGTRDCLVNMVWRRVVVPGTVLCTTIWIR